MRRASEVSEGDRIEAECRPFRRPKASDRSQVWTKARSPEDSSRVPETSSWGSHSKRRGPSKRGRTEVSQDMEIKVSPPKEKSINRCEAISLTLSKLENLSPPSNQSIKLHQRGRNRSSMAKPTFLGQNQFNVSKITTTLPKGIIFIEINDNDTTVLNLDAGSVRQEKRIEFGQSERLSHPGDIQVIIVR